MRSSGLGITLAALLIGSGAVAEAAPGTWQSVTTDDLWSTVTNWNGGLPGTGDIATFNGPSDRTAITTGTITLGGLLFDTSSVAVYTLGGASAGTGQITLNNAGTITVDSTVTASQTINANLVLGTSGTFANGSASAGQSLILAGSVTGLASSASALTVAGAGNTTMSGPLVNGAGGTLSLTKTGAGSLSLSGSLGFTGGLTISGGTVSVAANTGTSSIGLLTMGASGGSTAVLNVSSGNFVFGTSGNSTMSASAGQRAVMNISGSASVSNGPSGFLMSANAGASLINQSGGLFAIAGNGMLSPWDNSGYGGYVLSSGTLRLTAGQIAIGNGGSSSGLFSQTGGLADLQSNFYITQAGASVGVVDVSGGTMQHTAGQFMYAGGFGTSGQNTSILNIRGSGLVQEQTGNFLITNSSNTATGIVNVLTGGTLEVNKISKLASANAKATINFDGGTLKVFTTNAGATFLQDIDNAFVYGGGVTVDTNNQSVTIGQALTAPAGFGIGATGSTLSVVTGGTGYIAAPVVTFSVPSGGGVAATGVATIDANGVVAGITITSPGSGYSSGEAVTVRFNNNSNVSGAAATAASSFTVNASTANTSGGLTKTGTGTLTLTGSNTYAGPTAVNVGTLRIGNGTTNGSILNSAIVNNAAVEFNVAAATSVAHASSITGTGSLTKTGAGSLSLSGSLGFTGGLTISGGTVSVAGNAGTSSIGLLTMGASGGSTAVLNVSSGNFVFGTSGNSTMSASAGQRAVMNISGSASVSNGPSGFLMSANAGASLINQSGGLFTIAGNGMLSPWDNSGYGGYVLSSGTLQLTAGQIAIGNGGSSSGLFSQTGGLADLQSNFYITQFGSAVGVVDVSGGTMRHTAGQFMYAGGFGASGQNTSILSIRSSGLVQEQTGNFLITNSSNTATGIVNVLTGGTLEVNKISKLASANAEATLNFDGGTLKVFTTNAGATFLQDLDNAFVYGGGVTVDTNGQSVTIGQALTAPAGFGIGATGSTLSVVSGGTGYIAAPVVTFSAPSGGGVAATGVATIDANGVVTGITITSPGSGYSSAEAVTVTFNKGSNTSGAAATAASSFTVNASTANTSGGLTKTGTGTLTLTGSNSYAGPTVVNVGTLQIGNGSANGTIGSGSYSIGANATLALNYATAVAPTWSRITGAGTLSLNSAQAVNGSANWAAPTLGSGFTGTLDLIKGRINGNATALGNASGVAIRDGAQFLVFDGSSGTSTFTQNFSIAGLGWGEGAFQKGALRVSGLQAIFSGSIALTGSSGLYTQGGSGGTINATGNVADNGNNLFLYADGGPITLSGNNTLTGVTSLGSGTTVLNSSQAFGGSSSISFLGGAIRFTAASAGQDYASRIKNSSSAIRIDTNGKNVAFAGVLDNTNVGGLFKSGQGRLVLSGSNAYSGGTTVSAGALIVNGAVSGDVVVNADAMLGGSGVLGETLSGAGTISVGNSPGIGTAASVDPSAGMDWIFEITGTAPNWGAGSSASVNDVLRLTDATPFLGSLGSGSVVDVLFDLTSGGPITQGSYLGGFFVDNEGFDLAAALENGTFRYWVVGAYGTAEQQQLFNVGAGGAAVTYSLLSAYDSALTAGYTVTQQNVDFGAGTVSGAVTAFVVVPEPEALTIVGIGAVFAGWILRKSRTRAGGRAERGTSTSG